MTGLFVCPNCGGTHSMDSEGGCFLEMLVAVAASRGAVPQNLLVQVASGLDMDTFWDEFMDPAVESLVAQAKALAPKPRRRRGTGVPTAARARVQAQPAVPTKTFQVLMGDGTRRLYQAPDKETAESFHRAACPRDKPQQTVEIRR